MHKSLLEAWVAIKMPMHLVLVSLLHKAVCSGIPLQDCKNKCQLFTEKKKKEMGNVGIHLCTETTVPICFSGATVQ